MDDNRIYCQCCGESVHPREVVKICVDCCQAKFVPRLNWQEIAFLGAKAGYTVRGWWDKIGLVNGRRIRAAAEEKQKEIALRQQWGRELDDEPEEKETIQQVVSNPLI